MGLDQSIYSYSKEYKQLKEEQTELSNKCYSLTKEWLTTDEANEVLTMIALKNKELFDKLDFSKNVLFNIITHYYIKDYTDINLAYNAIAQLVLAEQLDTINEIKELLLRLKELNKKINKIKYDSKHEEVYFRKYHTLNDFMCAHLGADNCEPIIIYKENVEDAITYCISNPEGSNDTNYIGDLKELVADWDDNKIYTYEPWW